MSPPDPMPPPQGVRVGPYTVKRRLGEGGMGVVHFAQDDQGRAVALKVIRPQIVADHNGRERLAREVESLSRVKSPLVAEVVDADPWGPIPYVATRYVAGPPLSDVITDEGPLGARDLVWFARALAHALEVVHAAGIVHRDVKPGNVLMEGRRPILIDFGLARAGDAPQITQQGFLIGTPGYLAPEILQGREATFAADIHSWASTVTYAALGRSPFGGGPSAAIMDRVRRGEHDLSGVPDLLIPLLTAALDPDPAARPTLPELLAELDSPDLGQPARESALAPTAVVRTPASLPPTRVERWDELSDVEDDEDWDESDSDEEEWDDIDDEPASLAVKTRRFWLLVALLTVAGAAVAALPVVALAGVSGLVWVLRGVSLASDAVNERQQLRGEAWHDSLLATVSLPWYLLLALPGWFLLVGWGASMGLAGGLLGYAITGNASVGVWVGSGLLFVIGVWTGPGAHRVREPVQLAIRPLADTTAAFATAILLCAVALSIAVMLVDSGGPNLAPYGK